MTRRSFYTTLAAVFLVGLAASIVVPEPTASILFLAVPISIAAAVASTAYLAWIFRKQPVPRSRFFRMLVETFVALLVLGGWVGYLTVLRLASKAIEAGLIDDFPIAPPPPSISAPISALLVIVTFAAPVRFALEVYRARRTVRREGGDEVDAIDREEGEEA